MNRIILILMVFLLISGGVFVMQYLQPKQKSTLSLPASKVNARDGAAMVLIPAGKFLRGTSKAELASWLNKCPDNGSRLMISIVIGTEMPQRKVELDDFYMYKTEVTVAQYRKFCKATKHVMPDEPTWKWKENHPIVNITWYDAKAYADWAGVALPTEAQWEKAARGTDGRIYPWGDGLDLYKSCNESNSKDTTAAVGSYPADISPYSVMDMTGNVAEFCADWYGERYYKSAPAKNPTGPATGTYHVTRGGSWSDCDNRCARREGYNLTAHNFYLGFRCAVPPPRQ